MAEIIEFKASATKSSPVTQTGYIKVPQIIIGRYFAYELGDGIDLYAIKHFKSFGFEEEIDRGYVPQGKKIKDVKDLLAKQTVLLRKLSEDNERLPDLSKTDIWQDSADGYATAFIRCADGIIGCGWFDHARTQKKGLKMAAFLLYAFGQINAGYDEKLSEVTRNYIPYNTPLSRSDLVEAEKIFFQGLEETKL